jgi:hypothetical protein
MPWRSSLSFEGFEGMRGVIVSVELVSQTQPHFKKQAFFIMLERRGANPGTSLPFPMS